MSPSRTAKRWMTAALLALGTTTLIACGPGGGSGNGGGRTAGIEGTGVTSGFGSVYVGGIEFATDDAVILFNGNRVDEQALRVGDVMRIGGVIDTQDESRGRAQRIAFDTNLKGPIERIDRQSDARGALRVLGQQVRYDASTHFVEGTDPAALEPGDLVAISGFGDGNGALRATLIENDDSYEPGATLTVEGRVADLGSNQFDIGDLSVHYDGASIADGNAIAAGDAVRVTGQRIAAEAPLTAQRIERIQRRIGADGERVFVDGLVSDIDGDRFTVAGQRIDASNAERTGAVEAPLDGDTTVTIDGVRRGNLIVADTLRINAEPQVMLRARLDTVDGADSRVVLLGSEWNIEPNTRYLDQTDPRERRLRLNRLAAGDTIQAVGYAGNNGLIMTRLDRVPADAVGNALLRAPLQRVERSGAIIDIRLAGTAATANASTTRFENAAGAPISADMFAASATPGALVEVQGPANADRINVATSVKLLE